MSLPSTSGHDPLAVIAAATTAQGRASCAITTRIVAVERRPIHVATIASTSDGNHVRYIARPVGAHTMLIDSVGSPYTAMKHRNPRTNHHGASHHLRAARYDSASPTTTI